MDIKLQFDGADSSKDRLGLGGCRLEVPTVRSTSLPTLTPPDCALITQFKNTPPQCALSPPSILTPSRNSDIFTCKASQKCAKMSDFNSLQTHFDSPDKSVPDDALFTPFSEGSVWHQILSQQATQSPWTDYLALTSLLSRPDAEPSARACAQGATTWPAPGSLVLRTPSPRSYLTSPETLVAGYVTDPVHHCASSGEFTALNLPDVAGPKKKRTRVLTDRRRETNAQASKRSRARKKEQFETMSAQVTKFRVSTPLRGDLLK